MYYTEQYHEDRERLTELRGAYTRIEDQLTRVYHDARVIERDNERLQDRLHRSIIEGDGILTVALEMIRLVPEDQRSAFMGRITMLLAGPPEVIDLVTDEELTDSDEDM